jgi:hypothetical protein
MCFGAEWKYVCGMWKENLAGFLMWQPDYEHVRRNSLSGVPKRHKECYAPSWSWASIIGPVVYKNLGGESSFGGTREPYPINRGEYGWDDETMNSLFNVLRVQSVQQGLNPFSSPKSATLNVRGYVASATLHSRVKSLPAQSSSNGGLLLGADKSSVAQADLEPDVQDAYAEVSIGGEVHLLFMMESRHAGDGISSYAWGRGLVLKPAASGGSYSRVGTFHFQGDESWGKWRELRKEHTLWLI